MPSAFRSSRSGRQLDSSSRSRSQIDHDVFEGLPVRRWSRQVQTISQAPKTEESDFSVQGPGGTPALPELPMPRDSQLLPAASRALLRAARAGCIYVRQSGRATKEEEQNAKAAEDQSNANAHLADRTFTSRKWTTHPKHLEPPEIEFLAKRRPGLPSLYGGPTTLDGSSSVTAGPMRRTKFQKVDPTTGNISIYEAWVPEGHRIEGEVTGDIQTIVEQSEVTVKPEAPAPGTLVEGVGIVNSEGVVVAEASSAAVVNPNKRRPPPPKRKGKGFGKGRKKKVMFAPGEGADAATVHGVTPSAEGGADGPKVGQDGLPISADQAGQDDDEDDGEDGDESDEGDESMIDAKTPETPLPQSFDESTDQQQTSASGDQEKDVEMKDAIPEIQPPVSEPSPAEPLSQAPASQDEAVEQETEVSASASATPAPPVEQTQEPAPEINEPPKEPSPPKDVKEPPVGVTDSGEGAKETEETAPKEETPKGETVDTPSTSVPAVDNANESPAAEKQSPGAVDTTANENQIDSQAVKPEENTPAFPSATPEEKPSASAPSEEPPTKTESENAVEDIPQPPVDDQNTEQPEILPVAQEDQDAADNETRQDPVEEEKNIDLGDVPNPAAEQQSEQQVSPEEPAIPSEKPASPAVPPAASEPELAVEPAPETTEVSAPEAAVSEPSAPVVAEPAEPEAKAEESAEAKTTPEAQPEPAPEPEAASEPEAKKEEPESEPNPTPAADAE